MRHPAPSDANSLMFRGSARGLARTTKESFLQVLSGVQGRTTRKIRLQVSPRVAQGCGGVCPTFLLIKTGSSSGNMSVLTEEQVAVYMDAASSDIKFLLDKEDVDRLTQARLYEAGVLSVKQFAVPCKDVEEMRETAVKELRLEMKTLKDKAKQSMLLVAFEIAKGRSPGMPELGGESTVQELPKALPTPDYQGMREAYEKKFWEIEERGKECFGSGSTHRGHEYARGRREREFRAELGSAGRSSGGTKDSKGGSPADR